MFLGDNIFTSVENQKVPNGVLGQNDFFTPLQSLERDLSFGGKVIAWYNICNKLLNKAQRC